MRRTAPLLALTLALAPPADARDAVQATRLEPWLYVVAEADGWRLEREGRSALPLALPDSFQPYAVEWLRDGWILTGTAPMASGRDLILVRGGADGALLLPVPAGRTGARRVNPVPLVSDGRLRGLVWIEGDAQDDLEVRAAPWREGWGAVETVAARGGGAQLALDGAILAGGDWLLVWSGFDGEDDEILWSQRHGTHWSTPRRIHADNAVPDVTPSLVGDGDGALLAWSGFEAGHYRLHRARFESGSWRRTSAPPHRGVSAPRTFARGETPYVLYRSQLPEGWFVASLGDDADDARFGFVAEASHEAPALVRAPGGETALFWPDGTDRSGAPRLLGPVTPGSAGAGPADTRAPSRLPTAEEFRWLAFGDSITFGSFDEANKGGYPGRLDTSFGCSPGVCEVDNQGVGGERTGQGVTRIEQVLAAKGYDVLLLMEGTNDIFRSPPISNSTIQFNLETMALKARAQNVDTVLASIIHFHPNGTRGNSRDDEVEDLRNRLIGVAAAEAYYFVDPWAVLCPAMACFNQHYFPGVPSPDPVGHPDASGYDILTGVFEEGITSVPVPGAPLPIAPTGGGAEPTLFTWSRESPVRATWYEISVDGPTGPLGAWFRAELICDASSCSFAPVQSWSVGTHSWRVRARNPAGRSEWSPFESFVVHRKMPFESPASNPGTLREE